MLYEREVMKTVPLDISAQAQFASDGTATVTLGPNTFGHSWKVALIGISSTSVAETEFFLYQDFVSPGRNIGGSWSGNKDFDGGERPLSYGQKLIGTWINGDPGTWATMIVQGTVTDIR